MVSGTVTAGAQSCPLHPPQLAPEPAQLALLLATCETSAGELTGRVTLKVTDDEGCSARRVYTGQTASCEGGPGAVAVRDVVVR